MYQTEKTKKNVSSSHSCKQHQNDLRIFQDFRPKKNYRIQPKSHKNLFAQLIFIPYIIEQIILKNIQLCIEAIRFQFYEIFMIWLLPTAAVCNLSSARVSNQQRRGFETFSDNFIFSQIFTVVSSIYNGLPLFQNIIHARAASMLNVIFPCLII